MMQKINNLIPRVCISGINGRMGHQLVRALSKSDRVILGAALTKTNSRLCGTDVGKLIGFESFGVIIRDCIMDVKDDFDILIDFTRPEATLKYIDFCCRYNKNMVIGTTGFTDIQRSVIHQAARQIGIVFSSNFSIGINVMLKLLQITTKIMKNFVDIDIIDIHHRDKIDSPSGTALTMKEHLLTIMSEDNCCESILDYYNQHLNVQRELCSVKMTSIRSGSTIGEHTVFFSSDGERLEIAHKAFDRKIYATGAIQAAFWLNVDKVGLFNMLHVLGLV
ncbi:4-hydroxy-tetrahydrodipicolinate reductase [Blochmannia endosymbiont of Colobopsis nipponica]|uniref:4-hydroxy-tetrahydrodipicolinate reductase n=1 Tax=Blochmannia endosymbiont of Colobopsis nipponica TaxID=2681987 RepID=UPI00178227C9|nr:4-hydroxy-tetrahydrodipicolinate reductase [Blochmannia endosymbiont of Colobopsis nipponica]QOI11286.1 4-hydroxy-tetrahydrodipicolinate reductase [Blochmannia endosymbiont of Colobopsis nipponica]